MKSFSHVRLFVIPWTVTYQTPPSMGFSRQGYWSGVPFPSSGDLPDPGIKPKSPALQADTLPSESPKNNQRQRNNTYTQTWNLRLSEPNINLAINSNFLILLRMRYWSHEAFELLQTASRLVPGPDSIVHHLTCLPAFPAMWVALRGGSNSGSSQGRVTSPVTEDKHVGDSGLLNILDTVKISLLKHQNAMGVMCSI